MAETAAMAPALREGAQELGLTLDARQAERLLALIELVAEWNTRVNLTAITAPDAMLKKHLLDSLTIVPHLSGDEIIDVGTGAGFPGLPLAIAEPRRRFTLIDSTQKKIRFVTHAVSVLGLHNVTAVHIRAEDYRPAVPASTVVARALGPVSRFIAEAGHLVRKGGRLIAMKGREPRAELASLPRGFTGTIVRLHVPGLKDERHAVLLTRT
jgi:16S rRNA (guanine527-N7)-methyltransferase